MKDEPHQVGYTEDPNLVNLEPGHDTFDTDDSIGRIYIIDTCRNCVRRWIDRRANIDEFRKNLTQEK